MIDQIICGDCLEVLSNIEDDSVDCIITDPPYGINKGKIIGDESLDVWRQSLMGSYRVLKPDTFYCVFASVEKLPEVICDATKFFDYRWTTIFYIKNGRTRGGVGFSNYYPCLIFMKGKATIKSQMNDICVGAMTNHQKYRTHPYQKDIKFMNRLVTTFSKEGDLILDPFSGSGTSGVAAKRNDRHYICIEKEPEYCAIAEKRIAEML